VVRPSPPSGANYREHVKEFVVYTALRLLMLAATFAIVLGIWLLVGEKANIIAVIVIAFVISGIGSYFLLNGQREAFAQRVELRAARAAKAFDDRRAREDAD
jgi:hypothetical protein